MTDVVMDNFDIVKNCMSLFSWMFYIMHPSYYWNLNLISNLMEMHLLNLIKMKFCTYQDRCAVLAYAKFCFDLMSLETKVMTIFIEFGI